MSQQPVMRFKSHIHGKNADVTVWPDRIEWVHIGERRPLTMYMTRKTGDSAVIPVSAISAIDTHRDGMRFTQVRLYSSGTEAVAFRVSHGDAPGIRDAIFRLINKQPAG